MAANNTYIVADKARADAYPRPTLVTRKLSTVSAGTNADHFVLETVKAGERVVNFILYQDATMGASCTLQARVGTTALTAATTAGAASGVAQINHHADLAADTTVNILIGGANVGGTANVYYSYWRIATTV